MFYDNMKNQIKLHYKKIYYQRKTFFAESAHQINLNNLVD